MQHKVVWLQARKANSCTPSYQPSCNSIRQHSFELCRQQIGVAWFCWYRVGTARFVLCSTAHEPSQHIGQLLVGRGYAWTRTAHESPLIFDPDLLPLVHTTPVVARHVFDHLSRLRVPSELRLIVCLHPGSGYRAGQNKGNKVSNT